MAKKLYTHTVQLTIHAPKRFSAAKVAGLVDQIIGAGMGDAEASAESDPSTPSETVQSLTELLADFTQRGGAGQSQTPKT